jgi:amidase
MNRRRFLGVGAAGAATAVGCRGAKRRSPARDAGPGAAPAAPGAPAPSRPRSAFALEERTIADLQAAMTSGELTARSIAEQYLARIEAVDRNGPELRSVLETNPDALAIADALDGERRAGTLRGPLHGIPILLKDNIDTADRMTTTAGSLALEGSIAPRDSGVASRLREAGAVLLGKANLSEWANMRSTRATSGWSGRGGQCKNPYDPARNPSGSSAGPGAATAANLCAAAIGTETDGSIISPAAICGLVGIKPTVGLVSRSGIIPISQSQDTAGPMARTVADAAALLSGIAALAADERDPATAAAAGHAEKDYTRFLDPAALKGARIGVARKMAGFDDRVDAVMATALDAMRSAGATVVDPIELEEKPPLGADERVVLRVELKAGLNAYLAQLPPSVKVRTLADLIAFNEAHRDREMPFFGQEHFIAAQAMGGLDDPAYRAALARNRRMAREEGIDAVMDRHQLDAIVHPSNGPAWVTDHVLGDHYTGGSCTLPAIAGYPHITVPAGFVADLPIGISLFGRAWSEPKLLSLAYAFEQLTKARRPPRI